MADKPIPADTANEMIKGYLEYMNALGVDMNKQTQSVSFGSAALLPWLTGVMRSADELRIFTGLYPPGHTNAGHTTVILWPYLKDKPATDGSGAIIDPFNDGLGHP